MAMAEIRGTLPAAHDVCLTTDLALALITTRIGFDNLEADWNALFARAGRSAHVFQTFNWNWHWANHFLAEPRTATTLAVITGRRDGELVMVWPLVMERRTGLRTLAWMGEPVSQYGDVLMVECAESLDMLRAAWRFGVATLKPDLARLNKTRADSVISPLLAELGAISTQQLEAPFLDLGSALTFKAYEERYSIKDRKNRQRLARRLNNHGAVSYITLVEGADAAKLVRTAIEIKRIWLKDEGLISPALADARTLAFFEAAAADAVRPTQIRVAAVICDTAVAAVEIAFLCQDRAAIHIMAYDRAFEKTAAGLLLLERMIATSLEQGVKVYDLMAPGDGYKKDWADGVVRVDDFAMPLTIRGRVFAHGFLAFARPRLKAAIARIPLSTRRRIGARLSRAVLVLGGV